MNPATNPAMNQDWAVWVDKPHHYCNDLRRFNCVNRLESPERDENDVEVLAYGEIIIPIADCINPKSFILTNVAYHQDKKHPDLSHSPNIISMKALQGRYPCLRLVQESSLEPEASIRHVLYDVPLIYVKTVFDEDWDTMHNHITM